MRDALHAAIMNLPCEPNYKQSELTLVYSLGHRDARHAAAELALGMRSWISVKDQPPPQDEPVVYARPNPRRPGVWNVGIAYWTVSQKWNPEAESQQAPHGFTHWKPLGDAPDA